MGHSFKGLCLKLRCKWKNMQKLRPGEAWGKSPNDHIEYWGRFKVLGGLLSFSHPYWVTWTALSDKVMLD